MSNFPNQLDSDVTLPPVNNNVTEIGGDAINALRDAVLNIEEEIGTGTSNSTRASGSAGSIAARLGVSLDPDGYIKPSALVDLGLVALPIYDGYIAPNAQIKESKLHLDHKTQDLFNNILGLSGQVGVALGWINDTGIKVNPHVAGIAYRHELSHIESSFDINKYFKNRFDPNLPNYSAVSQTPYRNNADAYVLFNDLNNDYIIHQKSDGYLYQTAQDIVTLSGLNTYPSNFAHTAGGIYLDSNGYTTIPATIDSLQKLADYIDQTSLLLLGGRIRNLYSNGISRVSSSSTLPVDGYGPPVVPVTKVTTYLLNINPTTPNDYPNKGDDIIQFTPDPTAISTHQFDAQFSNVKVGDVIRVNYGGVQTEFLIKEKKYLIGTTNTYAVRIDGKNLFATSDGYARIDRPTFNPNKYGVLAVSPAQILDSNGVNELSTYTNYVPSMTISHPRGAVALGNGFDPAQLDSTNYNLYLALYPDGNPANGVVNMPPVDVTGNQGTTPGLYTLDYIVNATNNGFRQRGINSRFVAYSYNGQFGIMLADSYNNAGFSIISGVIDSGGTKYDNAASQTSYPENIIRYDGTGGVVSDPLGFSYVKSGVASPAYTSSYSSAGAAYGFPTKVYLPLKRNNYYINGVEKDNFAGEIHQLTDDYGDHYWVGKVVYKNIIPIPPTRVELRFRVNNNLSTSSLAIGKTLVVQSLGEGNIIDYGRYIIKDISFNPDSCSNDGYYTDITVYDSIQGTSTTGGISPPVSIPVNSAVDGYTYALYFNSDSVTFNNTNSFDSLISLGYKRHFEIYTDQAGKSFSQERGRMNITGADTTINGVTLYCSGADIAKINIVRISPKLRGYTTNNVTSIVLKLTFDTTSLIAGRLMSDNVGTNSGPFTIGRKGEIIRFYDETNTDYIDFILDIDQTVGSFTDEYISIQLFPTMAQDDEVFLLASCQLNASTNVISHTKDLRQFGNTSEKDLTTSALNYISAPERLIHSNGVVRGFNLVSSSPTSNEITIDGGIALVNGKFVQLNNTTFNLPPIMEYYSSTNYDMNWCVCVNDKNEIQLIPLLDNTSSLPYREFFAVDITAVSPTPYQLDADYFSVIILLRKDLTPIYNIKSTVTSGPTYSNVIVTDIRKFINNEPSNNDFTWTDANYGLNITSYLRNPDSVLFWNENYGDRNNIFKIKGRALASSFDLSVLTKSIIFEGDSNGATLQLSGDLTLPNVDIIFKNLNIEFNNPLNINSLTSNTNKRIFENVNIIAVSANLGNIDFKNNCILNNVKLLQNDFVTYLDVNSLSIGDNCDINRFVCGNILAGSLTIGDNNKIDYSTFGTTSSGLVSIGDNCTINNSSFPSITSGTLTIGNDCQIDVTSFGSTSSGSITIGDNCSINNSNFPSITSGDLTIGTYCQVIKNIFNSLSNGRVYIKNYTNLVCCHFYSINATGTSDALYLYGDNVNIQDCIFETLISVSGKALRIRGDYINIKNCNFSGAITSSGSNAVLINGNNCTLDGCIISTITSSGSISFLVSGSDNIIQNCSFADITSSNSYAITINAPNNIINNCFFTNVGSTSTSGGAIAISGDDIIISNTSFNDITSSMTASNSNAIIINGSYCQFNNININNITGNVNYGIYITGNYIDLNKLYITNLISGTSTGLYVSGENCKIINSNLGILEVFYGIRINNNKTIIDNNIFTYKTTLSSISGIGGSYAGIRIEPNKNDITINNCKINNDGSNITSGNPPSSISCHFISSGQSLKNIYITNNKFTVSNYNDATVSAIAFIQEGTGGTNPNIINNIFVENNTTDKLMSMYIVGQSAGTSLTTPGIKALNVNITGNSFYRLGLGINSGGTIIEDKKLTVSNNDIDVIDAADYQGNSITAASASALGSGNLLITNNKLTFFKYVFQNNITNKSSLILDSNIFESKDSILAISNAIELVDSENDVDSSCVIKNNIIKKKGTSNYTRGIVVNNTGYDNTMSCQIIGNSISGLGASGYGIYCATYGIIPTIITNNTITRGSGDIIAYINGNSLGSTTGRHALVVDNTFDYDTTDGTGTAGTGTNTDVISNRGDYWVVERNINQIETTYIFPGTGNFSVSEFGTGTHPGEHWGYIAGSNGYITGGSIWTAVYQNVPDIDFNVVRFHNPNSLTADVYYFWDIDPRNSLPSNVKIIDVRTKISYTRFTTANSTGIQVLLLVYKENTSITPTGSVDIVDEDIVDEEIYTINFDPTKYVNTNNYCKILLNYHVYSVTTQDAGDGYSKPIQITYKW